MFASAQQFNVCNLTIFFFSFYFAPVLKAPLFLELFSSIQVLMSVTQAYNLKIIQYNLMFSFHNLIKTILCDLYCSTFHLDIE